MRGSEISVHSDGAREVAAGKSMEWFEARSSASGVDRSLSVLLQGAERTRAGRFHQNSKRRPRRRAPHEPDLFWRRCSGTFQRKPVRGACLDNAGETFWPISAEGDNRSG